MKFARPQIKREGESNKRRCNMERRAMVTWMMAGMLGSGAAAEERLDAAIVNGAEAYRKAVLAGDAGAVVSTYREDAMELPPCSPPLQGRAAIEAYYRGMFQGPIKIAEFRFEYLEAKASGDMGYAAGTYSRKVTGTPAGAVEETGKFAAIVKRTGGEWKTVCVIYNSDAPSSGH